jgi:sugar lactone lactonase YvrE
MYMVLHDETWDYKKLDLARDYDAIYKRDTLDLSPTSSDLKPFAARGGESVAVGADGRVFVANGQVFVYAANGAEIGRIDVPARPLQLLFGGADGRTLFILTHHALYAAHP